MLLEFNTANSLKPPVNPKKIKINKEPKKNLPKITILELSSFSACFEIVFSTAQNKVAVKIIKSPILKEKDLNFSNKMFPVNNKIAPISHFLLIFSFKKISANKAI